LKGKGQLIINVPGNREFLVYQCSLCGQEFLPAEDRSAKEAMTELLAVFKEHMREQHPEDSTGSKEPK
jgi:hypothetical protein